MSLTEDFSKFLITNPKSVRGFNLKNHEELKKNSQLIEKWHRFSLGVCEKSHTPGTDRVKAPLAKRSLLQIDLLFLCHPFVQKASFAVLICPSQPSKSSLVLFNPV